MALIAAHVNAEVSLVVTVVGIYRERITTVQECPGFKNFEN